MLKIEFFHDVICSFCFPMSYVMRKLQKQIPNVKITHRSFALIESAKDFDLMFTSRESAKDEILTHWACANEYDELNRFNIEGMKQASFLFPTSMPSLIACKAAYFSEDEEAYWDVFDSLQYAFFVKNLNIESYEVIKDCVSKLKIDLEAWSYHFNRNETKEAVLKDFELVQKYDIEIVPTLIINEKHKLSGPKTFEEIIDFCQKL